MLQRSTPFYHRVGTAYISLLQFHKCISANVPDPTESMISICGPMDLSMFSHMNPKR